MKSFYTDSAANICQENKANLSQNNRWSWMTAKLTLTKMDTWMVPRCMPDKFLVIVSRHNNCSVLFVLHTSSCVNAALMGIRDFLEKQKQKNLTIPKLLNGSAYAINITQIFLVGVLSSPGETKNLHHTTQYWQQKLWIAA